VDKAVSCDSSAVVTTGCKVITAPPEAETTWAAPCSKVPKASPEAAKSCKGLITFRLDNIIFPSGLAHSSVFPSCTDELLSTVRPAGKPVFDDPKTVTPPDVNPPLPLLPGVPGEDSIALYVAGEEAFKARLGGLPTLMVASVGIFPMEMAVIVGRAVPMGVLGVAGKCYESGSHEHTTYRSYRSVISVSTCCQLGSRP